MLRTAHRRIGSALARAAALALAAGLLVTACGTGSPTGTTGSSSQSGSAEGAYTTGSAEAAYTTGSAEGAYTTVSGRIVHRDNGAPYPRAYVRFGWLVNAVYEREADTATGLDGTYSIRLPAGQYQISAGDECDLNAGFTIVGRQSADNMITVPGDSRVDFVEYPITPGAEIPGVC